MKNECEKKYQKLIGNETLIKFRSFIKNNSIAITIIVIVACSFGAYIIAQNDKKNIEVVNHQNSNYLADEDGLVSIKNNLTQLKLSESDFNAALNEMRISEF